LYKGGHAVKRRITITAIIGFGLFLLLQPVKTPALEIDTNSYKASVHGNMDCESCHSRETQGKSGDKLKAVILENCVQCHADADREFAQSVHDGAGYGPDCVSCHGDHYILPGSDPSSLVYQGNISETCGKCHRREKVSFEESFHGKAAALGSKNAPDCTTCHGSHNILSVDNPAALVSLDNKTLLCGECHVGTALGAQFTEHYQLEAKGPGAPMYWVKKVFMWLILVVVGLFLIHIELDLWHKFRSSKS
jgi:hypothetical protein